MKRREISEAVAAMKGHLIAGDPHQVFEGAAIDSRAVRGGELFFALPGEHSDGHSFVGDALARGASATVVARQVPQTSGAQIVVPNVLEALHALTLEVRREVPRHLVAVTGSAGKTTTKELLVAMLAQSCRACGSPGNLNNLLGFPLALLALPDDVEWMVAEAGMSTPGELGRLSRLLQPEVAVFTNVRLAHLEAFDTEAEVAGLEQIREAKAELLEGLVPGGLVVANAADPETLTIGRRHRDAGGRTVWFAREGEQAPEPTLLTVRDIAARREGAGWSLVVERADDGTAASVQLRLHGEVALENFLAAATCAAAVGVPLEAIARGASEVAAQPGRGQLRTLPASGVLVVDDSYNSNPDALARALRSAVALPGARHWGVLGEMRELGRSSEELHRRLGAQAAQAGLELVVGVGEHACFLVEAAARAGAETAWFPDAESAAEAARDRARSGDVILVKGSRGVHLERVVAVLEQLETEAAAGKERP